MARMDSLSAFSSESPQPKGRNGVVLGVHPTFSHGRRSGGAMGSAESHANEARPIRLAPDRRRGMVCEQANRQGGSSKESTRVSVRIVP